MAVTDGTFYGQAMTVGDIYAVAGCGLLQLIPPRLDIWIWVAATAACSFLCFRFGFAERALVIGEISGRGQGVWMVFA